MSDTHDLEGLVGLKFLSSMFGMILFPLARWFPLFYKAPLSTDWIFGWKWWGAVKSFLFIFPKYRPLIHLEGLFIFKKNNPATSEEGSRSLNVYYRNTQNPPYLSKSILVNNAVETFSPSSPGYTVCFFVFEGFKQRWKTTRYWSEILIFFISSSCKKNRVARVFSNQYPHEIQNGFGGEIGKQVLGWKYSVRDFVRQKHNLQRLRA